MMKHVLTTCDLFRANKAERTQAHTSACTHTHTARTPLGIVKYDFCCVRCVLCAWRHRKAFRLCVLPRSVNEKKMRIRAVAAAARRKRTDEKNKKRIQSDFPIRSALFSSPSHSFFVIFPLSFLVCLSSCRVAIYTREHKSRCLRTLSCIYDEYIFFFWLVCTQLTIRISKAIKRCMPNNIYIMNLHSGTSTRQWLRGANCSNSQRDVVVEPEPEPDRRK